MLPQIVLSGIVAGSVYALIALGFVLIYKGTHVIHFGLGDQVTLGAYLVIIAQLYAGVPHWPAILLALIGSGAIGFLLERFVMRPIALQPILVQVIATLAIGLGIREGLRAFMGPQGWPFEFLLSPTPRSFLGIYFAWANVAVLFAAVSVMFVLYFVFAFSRFGRVVIATCENRTGAFLMGIPVPEVVSSIWIVSSILAAIAGILLAPVDAFSGHGNRGDQGLHSRRTWWVRQPRRCGCRWFYPWHYRNRLGHLHIYGLQGSHDLSRSTISS